MNKTGSTLKATLLIFLFLPVFLSAFSQQDHNCRLLLRDEGLSQISYIDIDRPGTNWYVTVPPGRDMQLVGRGRLMIGTGNGFEEHEIATGKKVFEVTTFPGTITSHRLRNGNTLLAGINWQGKQGIVLLELDSASVIRHIINFPGFVYVRLIRETTSGNLLVTADDIVFEGKRDGTIAWQAKITGKEKPHAWQALRMADGQTVVSCGYAANLQFFTADGSLIKTISGPVTVRPNFYAGFQVLANGNFLVINWQGHGPELGSSGTQLLEYSPAGELVWSWKQDAAKYSSLHAVISLDGLDTRELHTENANGMLTPVKNSRVRK